VLLHIATSFRTWIEKSSAFFHHRGVSTPHAERTCRRHVPTGIVGWLPDGSPAEQLTLGRHGPRRDAYRVRCLFLLLLSLEESNQRTLRNRNTRFNRHPACHRFRCVRSARRRESACTLHRNLTPSIEASLRTQPPIPRGAGFCCVACWCRGVVHDTPET
jgi:hypothetical protein